eukprot:38865-Eustigmatos_ZCMA.PRE.1
MIQCRANQAATNSVSMIRTIQHFHCGHNTSEWVVKRQAQARREVGGGPKMVAAGESRDVPIAAVVGPALADLEEH